MDGGRRDGWIALWSRAANPQHHDLPAAFTDSRDLGVLAQFTIVNDGSLMRTDRPTQTCDATHTYAKECGM
ncbi:hypothetical protein E4U54_006529 [Claviceps lovelessii]|nr:hypothetical protein E4U54_006529 [Claviceps lovelessii]